MTVPTSYTEDDLAVFMAGELGDVGADLGLSANQTVTGDYGDFTEPLNDALIAYGTEDITTITGLPAIATIRALARVYAWRLARDRAAARYDFADGTQNLKRSQMFAMIEKALSAAESEAAELGGGDVVAAIDSIHYSQDPYAAVPDALAAALGL